MAAVEQKGKRQAVWPGGIPKPIAPYRLKSYPVPVWEKRWIKSHPDLDPDTFT